MTRVISTLIVSVAAVAIVAAAINLRPDGMSSAATQAWSDRLTAQAEQQQRVRTDQAASARLQAQADAYFERIAARDRAEQAYAARLQQLAQRTGAAPAGMSQRVAAAWTARLNGLAEHLGR